MLASSGARLASIAAELAAILAETNYSAARP
jgi:hypothetical protein